MAYIPSDEQSPDASVWLDGQCPETCVWCEVYGTHDPELIAADDARQAEQVEADCLSDAHRRGLL